MKTKTTEAGRLGAVTFVVIASTLSLSAFAQSPSKCKPGEEDIGGGKCAPPCPSGQTRVITPDGAPKCQAPPPSKCKPGEEDIGGGKCAPPCPSGQTRVITPDGAPKCQAPLRRTRK